MTMYKMNDDNALQRFLHVDLSIKRPQHTSHAQKET